MKKKPIEILLIEGDPGEARLVQEGLAEAGATRFKLDWVDDLAKGLRALHRDPAAVILLDLNLPDSSGIDTLRKVHAQVPHIPIILLTGFEDEIQAPKAVQEGAQDYLVKGQLDGNFIVRAIRYAIERKQAEEELQLSLKQIEHNRGLLLALNQAAQAVQRARSPEEVYASLQEQMTQMDLKTTVFELQSAKEGLRIAYLNYDSRLVRRAEKLTGLSMNDFRLRPRQESIFQRVLAKGETVFVSDSTQAVAAVLPKKLHALARPTSAIFHLESSTFAPLTAEGKVIGVLAITGGNLSEADNPAVTAFANQAAIALHNARLFKDAQQELAQRKQVEEELVAEHNLFRTLIDNLPDAVYVKDTASRFMLGNAAVARVMGAASPDELIGKTDYDFFPEKLATQYFTDEQVVIQSGKAEINREEPIIYPDGSQGWVLTTQAPLRDQNGAVVGLVGIGRTITERKWAEEQLQLLKFSIDTAPDAAYWLDSEGRFLYVNETGCKTLGYTQVELMNMHVSQVNPRAIPQRWAQIWQDLKKKGTINLESVHRRKDGSEFPVELTSVYIKFGEKEYCNGFAKDISERKRAEETLHALYSRHEALLAAIPEIVMEVDNNKVYKWANQTGIEFFGEDVIGKEAAFYFEGEQTVYQEVPPLFNGNADTVYLDSWQRRKDGQKRLLAWWYQVLKDDAGNVTGALSSARDITEQKRAQETQQRSELLFRGLFELSPDAIVLIDPHDPNISWPIVDCNTATCQMNGYRRDELIGHSIDILNVTPGTQAERITYMEQIRKAGNLKYETNHRHKNATIFPIELSTSLIQVGERELVIGIDRDITERRRAQETLANTERIYRQAITQTGSFPYQRNYDEEKYAFLGEGFEQLTGYTPEEMTGALFNSRLRQIESYGESRHLSHEQRIQLAHQGGIKEWREDYAFERKDGALIWLADHAMPLYNDSGEIVGSLGILTDITERKRTEQALQISEERLRLITDNMLDMVVSTDLEGIILYASPPHKIILGYEPASMLGKSIYDFMHPEDIDQVRNFALTALQNKTSGTQEYRYRHADGHYIWQESTGALITDDQGTPIGAVFTTRDITERKRAEEALSQSEERYRNLFQNSLEGIGLSQGNKIIDANKALLDIFGYDDLAEFTKVPLLDHVVPAFQGLIREYLEKVNKGEIHDNSFAYQIIRKDQAIRDIEISVSHFIIGDDVYALSTFRDITESKLAEVERTRQAEELARLYRASSSLLTESPFDLPALARTILKIVLDEFGQSNCSLFLVEKGSDKLTRIAALGSFADQVSKVKMTLDGQGLVPQAIRTGQCINSRDVRTDPAYVAGWEMARSELTVPLKVGNQVIGAIDVQSAVMGFFSVDDERMMTIFAERAALALEHARLYTQTERRLENLTALRVVDTAIASSFDVNFTLGILLDQVTKRLGVEAVNIMVFNSTSQTIQTSVAQGFRPGRLGQSGLRLGENLARQVVRERRPIAIDDLVSATEEIPGVADLVRAGFKAYLGVPLIAKGLTKGVLEIYQSGPLSLDEEQRTFLDMLAGQAAIAIDSAQLFENLQGSNVELMMAYDETIEGWSQAMDLRDKETEGHSKRVTVMTVKLAASFGSTPEELIHIRRGALLHDIGKLGVPDEILRKPGPLTEEEWVIMRSHPQFAYEMLAPITYLHPALDIPYCHHEKWDGSGYPRGLKGNQIPLAARIFAVVDVWDALTSDRPYREAWTEEKALAYIKEQAGKHFDPGAVNAFFREIPDQV